MTEWTKAEAKAADAILATLYTAHYAASDKHSSLVDSLHRAANDKQRYYGRTPYWTMSVDEALAGAAKTAEGTTYRAEQAAKHVAAYPASLDAVKAAKAAIDAHEAEHYKGWLRFFLVQDGHIHRSTHCSSLRATTRIGWLPNLSGETEVEAVAEHGAMLCTKCFPSAPVEWTMGKPPAADQCPGSGERAVEGSIVRRRSIYGDCPSCGVHMVVTGGLTMRKHKLPKPGK